MNTQTALAIQPGTTSTGSARQTPARTKAAKTPARTKAAKTPARTKAAKTPAGGTRRTAAKVTAAAGAVIANAAREIRVGQRPDGAQLYAIRSELANRAADLGGDLGGYRFTVYGKRVDGALLVEVAPVPETKATAERVWGTVEDIVHETLPDAGTMGPARRRRS